MNLNEYYIIKNNLQYFQLQAFEALPHLSGMRKLVQKAGSYPWGRCNLQYTSTRTRTVQNRSTFKFNMPVLLFGEVVWLLLKHDTFFALQNCIALRSSLLLSILPVSRNCCDIFCLELNEKIVLPSLPLRVARGSREWRHKWMTG